MNRFVQENEQNENYTDKENKNKKNILSKKKKILFKSELTFLTA